MTPGFLPWQTETAKAWLINPETLAHAWLLHGLAGIGKRQYALSLAASLLCESTDQGLACGQCQACLWVRLGNHPDLMRVRPEALAVEEGLYDDSESVDAPAASAAKPSDEIKVEQIRSLEPWYHRTTHRNGWRIVLVYPGEALGTVSANALLKSLEEPPPNTMFLIVCDSPDRLLPTILSRCQKVRLNPPSDKIAAQWLLEQGVRAPDQWLAASGGAPLRALEMSRSLPEPCPQWLTALMEQLASQQTVAVGVLADELGKEPASRWLPDLQRLTIDLCLCCAGLKARYLIGLEPQYGKIVARQSLQQWTQLQQWMTRQTPLENHPLNPRLFAQACLQKLIQTAS